MIWNAERECMASEEKERFQLRHLRELIARIYYTVPFFRKKCQQLKVTPDSLNTLQDLRHFPFTTKDDLRENYPFGLFTRQLDEIVRLHASSGTTGNPTVVGYTQKDMDIWTECVARIVSAAGVGRQDIVQIAFGYGLFTGGFGLHYGCEKVGASVIPISSGNTRRQIKLMKDFGTTALVSTPSYAIYIAEILREEGIRPEELNLRWGLFGGEAMSGKMRKEIEDGLGIFTTDNYGLSEIIGPGVSGECQYRCGLHINEDHFLVETIDPDTLEPLPPGEKGELAFTTLTKEAMPLVRYRTNDISFINNEPCKCGRTSTRMNKIMGRTDDMLIIRGVNVFPSQIEEVLSKMSETAPHFQIVVDRCKALDTVEVWVEIREGMFFDEMKKLREVEQRISREIQSALGIQCKIKLVEPKTIERTAGKTKRVLDKRTLYEEV